MKSRNKQLKLIILSIIFLSVFINYYSAVADKNDMNSWVFEDVTQTELSLRLDTAKKEGTLNDLWSKANDNSILKIWEIITDHGRRFTWDSLSSENRKKLVKTLSTDPQKKMTRFLQLWNELGSLGNEDPFQMSDDELKRPSERRKEFLSLLTLDEKKGLWDSLKKDSPITSQNQKLTEFLQSLSRTQIQEFYKKLTDVELKVVEGVFAEENGFLKNIRYENGKIIFSGGDKDYAVSAEKDKIPQEVKNIEIKIYNAQKPGAERGSGSIFVIYKSDKLNAWVENMGRTLEKRATNQWNLVTQNENIAGYFDLNGISKKGEISIYAEGPRMIEGWDKGTYMLDENKGLKYVVNNKDGTSLEFSSHFRGQKDGSTGNNAFYVDLLDLDKGVYRVHGNIVKKSADGKVQDSIAVYDKDSEGRIVSFSKYAGQDKENVLEIITENGQTRISSGINLASSASIAIPNLQNQASRSLLFRQVPNYGNYYDIKGPIQEVPRTRTLASDTTRRVTSGQSPVGPETQRTTSGLLSTGPRDTTGMTSTTPSSTTEVTTPGSVAALDANAANKFKELGINPNSFILNGQNNNGKYYSDGNTRIYVQKDGSIFKEEYYTRTVRTGRYIGPLGGIRRSGGPFATAEVVRRTYSQLTPLTSGVVSEPVVPRQENQQSTQTSESALRITIPKITCSRSGCSTTTYPPRIPRVKIIP